MISQIAYSLVFGKPLVFYLGITVFASLALTALIGYLFHHGKNIPFALHKWLAALTIILGTIHGIFAASLYFNY